MKTKNAIYLITALVIAGLVFTTVFYRSLYKEQQKQVKAQQSELAIMQELYRDLSDSFNMLSKQRTYSISLAPNVNTKVSSVLGSSKQLTLQYYFTMDGNSIELKPDSVLQLKK